MSAILYTGDNVSVLREHIADDSVQLTVTSPPYDNLRKYNGYAWDFESLVKELYRVTKPGGIVVWVVADATGNGSETGTSFRQALYLRDVCGFNLHDTMIWDKGSSAAVGSITSRYESVFEYMFVFAKGKPTFNAIKDKPNKWAGHKNHGTIRQPDGSSVPKTNIGKTIAPFGIRANVWRINPEKRSSTFKHPAMYPEALAQDHILSWSNPGDTVLDTFSGSGTTGKMAVLNGRNYVGIEISPEYVDLSKGRIPGAEVYSLTGLEAAS